MNLDDLRKIAEEATPGPWITGGELPGAEFDRWLAKRDAEVAAKALEEAASAMREYGWVNPARMIYARAAEYRKEVQGD